MSIATAGFLERDRGGALQAVKGIGLANELSLGIVFSSIICVRVVSVNNRTYETYEVANYTYIEYVHLFRSASYWTEQKVKWMFYVKEHQIKRKFTYCLNIALT